MYPDALPFFASLAGHVKTAIVANQEATVIRELERDGLVPYIDVWGVSAVVGYEKPSPGERSQAANYGPVAVATLAEVAAKLGASAKRIRAISTTGTSGTIVPADKRGNPVGRAHHVQRRPRQGGTPPA